MESDQLWLEQNIIAGGQWSCLLGNINNHVVLSIGYSNSYLYEADTRGGDKGVSCDFFVRHGCFNGGKRSFKLIVRLRLQSRIIKNKQQLSHVWAVTVEFLCERR